MANENQLDELLAKYQRRADKAKRLVEALELLQRINQDLHLYGKLEVETQRRLDNFTGFDDSE